MLRLLRRLWRWLRRLLGLEDDGPDRLESLTLEVEGMSDVRLTWELPTPTSSQRPIASVRLEARADGVTEWTVINEVAAPTAELLVQDIAPGLWEFRGTVVDDAGAESSPVVANADVPFDAPSQLVSFDATPV